jgi:hypothetical protein
MSSFSSGCAFTLSFALIAAADLNGSVPMILVGRIIGGLAVGQYLIVVGDSGGGVGGFLAPKRQSQQILNFMSDFLTSNQSFMKESSFFIDFL